MNSQVKLVLQIEVMPLSSFAGWNFSKIEFPQGYFLASSFPSRQSLSLRNQVGMGLRPPNFSIPWFLSQMQLLPFGQLN